ncbi:hypothetical protein [Azospirillum argentinense]
MASGPGWETPRRIGHALARHRWKKRKWRVDGRPPDRRLVQIVSKKYH